MGLCETLVGLAPLSFLVKSRLSVSYIISSLVKLYAGAPLRSRRNLCRNLGGISYVYGSTYTDGGDQIKKSSSYSLRNEMKKEMAERKAEMKMNKAEADRNFLIANSISTGALLVSIVTSLATKK